MVIKDMARRVRPLLLTICVVAIALAAPITATTSTTMTDSDQHAAVAAAKVALPRAMADRAPKPSPPVVPLALLLGGLGSMALLLARHDRLIGRRMRRLHDVGHDWRSLLLGAPPALA